MAGRLRPREYHYADKSHRMQKRTLGFHKPQRDHKPKVQHPKPGERT